MSAPSIPFQAAADSLQERPWMLSLSIACGLHAALLFGITHFGFQGVAYGIRTGANNIEIELTAAPPATVATEVAEQSPTPLLPTEVATPSQPEPEKPAASTDDEVATEAQTKPTPSARPVAYAVKSAQSFAKADVTGDGSSPVPGRDATTMHSEGGAKTSAKPDYLLNPAPLYPEAARQRGQQGVVRLLVSVDERGKVALIQVVVSSNFPLLDESALKTVRAWKFHPARLDSIPIAAEVEVPIRFQLR